MVIKANRANVASANSGFDSREIATPEIIKSLPVFLLPVRRFEAPRIVIRIPPSPIGHVGVNTPTDPIIFETPRFEAPKKAAVQTNEILDSRPCRRQIL
jgi:hypothetical protein